MHRRAAEFVSCARDRYGIDVAVREFESGTETAAAAADAVDCEVGQIASSLVFVVDGDPVVAVTSGANRVSEAALAAYFEVDVDAVSMADPDTVRAVTGWSIGGVPPICHETDATTLFDPSLLDFDTVWAAAGTPESMWPVDPETLRELAGATAADVTE